MSVEFSIHRPCLWLLLFFLSLPAPGVGAIDYVATAGAVSFDQVMALPAGTAVSRFEYGEAPSQFAELWLPQAAPGSPLVIFIHGGCWLNAYGIDHSRPLSTALAGAGYAVWSLEYRRVGSAVQRSKPIRFLLPPNSSCYSSK